MNPKNVQYYQASVAAVFAVGSMFAAAGEVADDCDVTHGEKVFQKCAVCHSFDASGEHGATGPNLYGLIGRAVGRTEGYKFSGVLRRSGDVWTAEHLDAFLTEPMAVYPRTRMAFAGLKKAQDRGDVICYLSSEP